MRALCIIQADLGPELEDYIRDLVAKGTFDSEVSALRAGIHLVRDRQRARSQFDDAIDEGLADIEAGRIHSAEEVRERMRARSLADLDP